jgi:phosphotransferase system  glucose/maltose/N-acetylglucosamine-specific IIC component
MEMPVEKKENKTWPIVGTVAAILLCGCPGLSLCLFGAYTATGNMPDFFSNYGGSLPGWIGFALLCVAIIFIAIAVVVPILLLRKKKPATPAEDILPPQEPLPPAS